MCVIIYSDPALESYSNWFTVKILAVTVLHLKVAEVVDDHYLCGCDPPTHHIPCHVVIAESSSSKFVNSIDHNAVCDIKKAMSSRKHSQNFIYNTQALSQAAIYTPA